MTDQARFQFTVFTKPWRDKPLAELARFVRDLGFQGVELPVRPGYQVPPENVTKGLPEAAKVFADHGLKIGTIAGPTDEKTMAACAEVGVPIIRIMAPVPKDKDYLTAIRDYQKQWDQLIPLLERHGVAVGVQNHNGRGIANAMQLLHAIGKYDPRCICAIWDPAHNALEGERADIALDTIWSHLRVVNLKNAYWKLASPPEAPVAQWSVFWTTGRHGLANWPLVAKELQRRGYVGDLCFSAEYSEHAAVDRLIAEDIKFAKSLLA